MIEQLLNPTVITGIITAITTIVVAYIGYKTKVITEINKKEAIERDSIVNDKLDGLCKALEQLKLETEQNSKKMDIRDSRVQIKKNINEILGETLRFSQDIKVNNYITFKTQTIIDTLDIILLSLEDNKDLEHCCNETVIRGYFNESMDVLQSYGKKVISEEFITRLDTLAIIHVEKYVNDIIYILKDEKNSKIIRIGAKTISFLTDNLSLTLREYNRYISGK